MDPLDREPDTFDFDAHVRLATAKYQSVRPIYQGFAECIKTILREALATNNVKVASLEARVKSLESFGRKAAEPSESDPERPKYADPLAEITDLAGTRVITFFPGTIDQVDQAIEDEFAIVEKTDKAELLKAQEKFGYQSIHYLVMLKPNRAALPEYRTYRDLVGEIQVRTILQHAWAEIEHDIQYKSAETIPVAVRRRLMSLAGLLEMADREFEAIQGEDETLRQAARVSIEEGRLEQVEITPDALKAYLDRKLGPDGRLTEFSYQLEASVLKKLGFVNFKQLEECMGEYDDDDISRILWGSRQGQLTRFEGLLLAGMGEAYVMRHPWKHSDWFAISRQKLLEQLRTAGVPVRTYTPHESA